MSFFIVSFPFVLDFLYVLFSLLSFVLRSLAIPQALMVLDIVEGQRRGVPNKWPTNSVWCKNIEKIRGPQKWQKFNIFKHARNQVEAQSTKLVTLRIVGRQDPEYALFLGYSVRSCISQAILILPASHLSRVVETFASV